MFGPTLPIFFSWTPSTAKKKKEENGIGASIRIGREIQCLSYAGFLDWVLIFLFSFSDMQDINKLLNMRHDN